MYLGLAGRKCNVDFQTIQLPAYLAVKNALLDENGKIRYWKNCEVYNELSKKLNMLPKTIHQTIVRKSGQIFGKDCKQPAKYLISDDEFLNEGDFSIKLTSEDVQNFKFVVDDYSHTVLKSGWSNNMFDILSNNLNLPCVFNFDKPTVSNGEITTFANCKCGISLELSTQSNLTSLQVKVLNVGDGTHDFKNRRRLIGERTQYFAEKLKDNNPYNVLNEEISKDLAQNRTPRMQRYPSKNALAILRHRAKNKDALHESAIVAVRQMKYLAEYNGVIKEFGTDPLHLIFWNEYQVYYFHQIKKKQKLCISIDATGSLISTSSLSTDLKLNQNIQLPHVFLYLIMLKNENGKSEPIGQFLSADQHSRKIAYFLDVWKEDFCVPNEITVDDSAALIKASIQTFTSCRSTNEYIDRCQRTLSGTSENLECYIRLDVAHFVKNVMRNPVFRAMGPKQKQFYQCVIGVMIQCDSFVRITDIVEEVLIVATIPFESSNLPTENSLRSLKRLIKTHDFSSVFTSLESIDYKNKLSDDDDLDFRLGWFERIEKKVEKLNMYKPDETSSDVRDNFYVAHEFIPYFKKLCARIPLWTSVMNNYFGSEKKTSSSADVESQNNIIKNIIFHDVKLPIRLDTFMQRYISSIKGSIYAAVSEQEV